MDPIEDLTLIDYKYKRISGFQDSLFQLSSYFGVTIIYRFSLSSFHFFSHSTFCDLTESAKSLTVFNTW